jgi:hypothetical protein
LPICHDVATVGLPFETVRQEKHSEYGPVQVSLRYRCWPFSSRCTAGTRPSGL